MTNKPQAEIAAATLTTDCPTALRPHPFLRKGVSQAACLKSRVFTIRPMNMMPVVSVSLPI